MRCLLSLSLLLFFLTVKAQSVIYVDSSAASSGGGTSWSSAYKTLGEALNVANAGAATTTQYDINIAKGTYYPTGTQNGANRDSSFLILHAGVRLFGGYPSGGGIRNISTNKTVLSGNIGSLGTTADNSLHILALVNTALTADSIVLSGLNFTAGAADSLGYLNAKGIFGVNSGAIYISMLGGKVNIRDCNFYGNKALANGGAIYNTNSKLTLSDCTFTGNLTSGITVGEGGGAIYSLSNTTGVNNPISVLSCTFNGNATPLDGGAIYAKVYAKSAGAIRNCSFSNNNAYAGGAVYAFVSTTDTGFVVDSSSFTANAALGPNSNGGAVFDYNIANYGTRYRNCNFTANSSGGGGGAFYDYAGSIIERCIFTGNLAAQDGGGVFFNCPSTVPPSQIDSGIFIGNRSGAAGGGMYVTATANTFTSSSTAFVSRCTFLSDTAQTAAGGLWLGGNVSVQYCSIKNCRSDIGGGVYLTSTGIAYLTYCFIQGNAANYNGGGIYAQNVSASTFLRNSLFTGNYANSNGGALYDSAASPKIIFCTFSGDTAGFHGNALFNNQSSPDLNSCIVWDGAGSIFNALFGAPSISFSTVQGGYNGVGILNAQPRFTSPLPATAAPTASGNYSLAACSPTIDNADPQAYGFGTDIAGSPRTFGSNADQGAYEYSGLSPVTGPLKACPGANAQYASIAAGGAWSSSDTQTATINSTGLLTAKAPGLVVITYTVGASAPCAPTMYKIVRINPSPVINPIVGSPKDSLCPTSTINLLGNGSAGTWTNVNPTIGTVLTGSSGFVFSSGTVAGTAALTLTITDPATGCSASKNKVVTVVPKPNVAPIAGPDSFCFYNMIQLANTTPGGIWSGQNGSVSVSLSGVVSAIAPGNVFAQYQLTSPFGCIANQTRLVTALPRPFINPISGPGAVCLSDVTVQLSDATVGGNWHSADTSIAMIDVATGIIRPVTKGSVSFYYVYSDGFGCDDSVTVTSTIIDTVDVSVAQNGSQLIAGQSWATYSWLDCSAGYSPIPGETAQFFSPTQDGQYAVAVRVGACVDTSACFSFVTTGIQNANAKRINIFPNPASASITITIQAAMKETTILLMDVNGRILRQLVTYKQSTVLNTSQYSDGVYLLKVISGEETYYRTLLLRK